MADFLVFLLCVHLNQNYSLGYETRIMCSVDVQTLAGRLGEHSHERVLVTFLEMLYRGRISGFPCFYLAKKEPLAAFHIHHMYYWCMQTLELNLVSAKEVDRKGDQQNSTKIRVVG